MSMPSTAMIASALATPVAVSISGITRVRAFAPAIFRPTPI
jgi:hypothetical protein